MENRIVLTIHGNESMVTVGTTGRLCEKQYTFTEDENTKAYKAFQKRLHNIPGIDKADIGRHEVRIERFDAFKWRDFMPAAIVAIAKRSKFGVDYKVYVKDERPDRHYRHGNDGWPIDEGTPVYNPPIDFGLETETFVAD